MNRKLLERRLFLHFYPMKSILLFLCFPILLQAQTPQLRFLPEGPYDPRIPTPESWLGYPVGDWHVSHDQLIGYIKALDAASDRIQLQEYGRTHEHRPLVCLIVTAPSNHPRLEYFRKRRLQLCDPDASARLNTDADPSVVYMGYSIHGNEASGSNAALLVAYYLAAGQHPELLSQLEQTIILFDPCFNPDGLQRFSTWVNSKRARHGSPDPMGDEFNEPWPGGRTNHYWFDLNRDWLFAQQPESPGRIAIFQRWKPNILTDHHEMGPNSTFFFQPGVPSRVNPITPARNQELTSAIGRFHARALSKHNIPFFSREQYDDFYYGKGSTYPDANGCIGILFEQASSRGSAQETQNGLLTFPYTIRNQVITSLSTLEAAYALRRELNDYLKSFYADAAAEGIRDATAAYVFGDANTAVETREMLRILLMHQVDVFQLATGLKAGGSQPDFSPKDAFIVPVAQAQYRLIRAIFERNTQFSDSIFYDISAWTLPDALGLPWMGVSARSGLERLLGPPLDSIPPMRAVSGEDARYAYLAEAHHIHLAALMAEAHRLGLWLKVATKPFVIEGHSLEPGSVIFPVHPEQQEAVVALKVAALRLGIPLLAVQQGQSERGPDLGSNSLRPVPAPKVLLVTGAGISPTDAGDVWHALDIHAATPVTLMEARRLNRQVLSRYNVVVLADGQPTGLPADLIRDFVAQGNTVVAIGSATEALAGMGLVGPKRRKAVSTAPVRRPYGQQEEDLRSGRVPGCIFQAVADRSHPLCFGFSRDTIPVFLSGSYFYDPLEQPYANPLVLTQDPLLAGYLPTAHQQQAGGAAAATVHALGSGRIVCIAPSPAFRGFWWGTRRLLTNAVFFGSIIQG
jgi:hypothetical protein